MDENENIYYYIDEKQTWLKMERLILAEKWNNPAIKTTKTRWDQLIAILFCYRTYIIYSGVFEGG